MKTTSLVAAALLCLPLGVVAAPAINSGSAIVADKEAAKTVALEVSNMR